MKELLFLMCFITSAALLRLPGQAQMPERRISKSEYIEMYKDIAMEKMRQYNIPASITLAQGILESAYGNSELARKAHNHFGIKCHLEWTGKTFIMEDDRPNECFRVYDNPNESYNDHSHFLTSRPRYAGLFDLDIADYKGWAKGLKQAGYATNPKYPELLINIIEEFELFTYDRLVIEGAIAYSPSNPTHKEVTYRPRSKASADFEEVYVGKGGRTVYENNGLKFIYAQKGDDFYTISKDFAIYAWQIYKYNELSKKDKLTENQIIYLQRKKNKSATDTFHTVNTGETLYDISQIYGIKLKKLCKYNNVEPGQFISPGKKIRLRK